MSTVDLSARAAPLVVLGCGFAGTAAARLAVAAGRTVRATTRDPARATALRDLGIDARSFPQLDAPALALLGLDGADVLVCFPPDPNADGAVSRAVIRAGASVYVSSTAVYGAARGHVDEATPVDPSEPRGAARLHAEALYRGAGAVIVRAAGIYGPGRGIHLRLTRGALELPGGGDNVVSRVHVEDLARALLLALALAPRGETYVLADDTPVPQREAVAWLCARLGLPMPPAVPLASAGPSLRHDRAVDNAKIKRDLGLSLAYPSYREGFEACLVADGWTDGKMT